MGVEISWVEVNGAGWSWVEVDGTGWSWVQGLALYIFFFDMELICLIYLGPKIRNTFPEDMKKSKLLNDFKVKIRWIPEECCSL